MQYKKNELTNHRELLTNLLKELLSEIVVSAQKNKPFTHHSLQKFMLRFPKPDGSGTFPKDFLLAAFTLFLPDLGLSDQEQKLLRQVLVMKPVRTHSGVAPVTVLTKPFPCPGQCIFCPNDIRMPKSYLADEPGAQRAERNYFDPYLQTYNRLQALKNIGHPTDKIELIVLGGTWSFYPEAYQIWFITQCFKALNDFGSRDEREKILQAYREKYEKLKDQGSLSLTDNPQSNILTTQDHLISGLDLQKKYNQVISELYVGPEMKAGLSQIQTASWDELTKEHTKNELATNRCVGLVIETRPDAMSEAEVIRIRKLGCTKTQIGVQSLQDSVLKQNHRGHTVKETRKAFSLLRQAGFKIHAHWMANLYGSDVDKDKKDFELLFSDPDFHPDELKVYPCSLIGSAELMKYFKAGVWKPYSHAELLEVVSHTLSATPEYCRLTRVIRDIPSTDIVEGNKLTNFREIAQKNVDQKKQRDIRAREIRRDSFDLESVTFETIPYKTSTSTEIFIQAVAPVEGKNEDQADKRLLAFLRLSLPRQKSFIQELADSAVVREVHVYGPAQKIGGSAAKGKAQHKGFGTQLLDIAAEIAKKYKFEKMSVISAVGTREYYRKRGFFDGELYQHKSLVELS